MNKNCFNCGARMKVHRSKISGVAVDGLKSSKCGDIIFTQEQALAAARAIDQKRLKDQYLKKPVRIGNSLGVIFPKDVVSVFNLEPEKTRLDIRADKTKGKIEITVL